MPGRGRAVELEEGGGAFWQVVAGMAVVAAVRGSQGRRRLWLGIPRKANLGWNSSSFFSSSSVPATKLFIDGKFVESKSNEWIDIHNPATNEVVGRVPKTTHSEMEAAMASCKNSLPNWSQTSILSRQQVFLRYQQLIKDNLKEISKLITLEQGKTLADAEGDVFRGLRKLLVDTSGCTWKMAFFG